MMMWGVKVTVPMIKKKCWARYLICTCWAFVCCVGSLQAEQPYTTLNAIFNQHEYEAKRFGPAHAPNFLLCFLSLDPAPLHHLRDGISSLWRHGVAFG